MSRRHPFIPLAFVVAAFLLGLASCSEKITHKEVGRVIYGSDGRSDDYELRPTYQNLGASVVAVIAKSKMRVVGNIYSITDLTTWKQKGICSKTRFSDQMSTATCSGFLISRNQIATSADCIQDQDDCSKYYFVFDFIMTNPDDVNWRFTREQVFECASFVSKIDTYINFAIVKLNRATRRNALTIDTTIDSSLYKIYSIGHLGGLPRKFVGGGSIQVGYSDPNAFRYFITDLDTFDESAGSPVFYEHNNRVAGIMLYGAPDFVWDYRNECRTVSTCMSVTPLARTCFGQKVTVSSVIKPYMPVSCTSEFECGNNGICVNSTCTCNPGFYGTDCSFQCSSDICNNNGECVGLWECKCNQGFSGSLCGEAGTKWNGREEYSGITMARPSLIGLIGGIILVAAGLFGV